MKFLFRGFMLSLLRLPNFPFSSTRNLPSYFHPLSIQRIKESMQHQGFEILRIKERIGLSLFYPLSNSFLFSLRSVLLDESVKLSRLFACQCSVYAAQRVFRMQRMLRFYSCYFNRPIMAQHFFTFVSSLKRYTPTYLSFLSATVFALNRREFIISDEELQRQVWESEKLLFFELDFSRHLFMFSKNVGSVIVSATQLFLVLRWICRLRFLVGVLKLSFKRKNKFQR